MNLEEQLLQTFTTLAERIRDEAERQVADAVRPIVEAAAADRAAAVAEAAADARAVAEQAAAEMLAHAEVRAREAGQQAGFAEGRKLGWDEGFAAGRAEGFVEGQARGREEGREQGREEGLHEGRAQGREEGREAGREEGRVEGRVEGRAEGAEQARAEGFAEGRARGYEAGLAEGREAGRADGHQAGFAEGQQAGLATGLTRGRQEATAQRRAESLAALGSSGSPQVARLLDSLRSLDQAQSLSTILDELAEATSHEAARVSILLAAGDQLRVWRSVGFPAGVNSTRWVEFPCDAAGLINEAIQRREVVEADSATPGAAPAFIDVPPGRHMLALPIALTGHIVALVYADEGVDESVEVSPTWAAAVDILTRHAARCLESVMALRAAQFVSGRFPWPAPPEAPTPASEDGADSARRYARLLLSEIKLQHEAAVMVGRREHDLAQRLAGEIARARERYEQRVPLDVQESGDYFEQELVSTLANGDPALLGEVSRS